jgi:hypothetical protein
MRDFKAQSDLNCAKLQSVTCSLKVYCGSKRKLELGLIELPFGFQYCESTGSRADYCFELPSRIYWLPIRRGKLVSK